jgi:methylase of polypeptide subunit release factors
MMTDKRWNRGRNVLMYRRSLIGSAATAGLLPGAARAQPFPSKQLRLLVGFAAGGGGDIVARILARAPNHLEPGGLLVCEVGDGRAEVQRRWRALKLAWPKAEVFSVERDALASAASKDGAARGRSTPARARR